MAYTQQFIDNCISSVDEVIKAHEQKLELLKEHKIRLMQQLFPSECETLPRLRFPKFNNDGAWEVKKLETLAKQGARFKPNNADYDYYNTTIQWLSLADLNKLNNGIITHTEKEIYTHGITNLADVNHPPNSVVLCRSSGVGKCAIMGTAMAVSPDFVVWICNNTLLSPWFLYYLLCKMKHTFERESQKNNLPIWSIEKSFFTELCVTIPAIAEQENIANCLNSINQLINSQCGTIYNLKIYKKGLMQKLQTKPT